MTAAQSLFVVGLVVALLSLGGLAGRRRQPWLSLLTIGVLLLAGGAYVSGQ